MTHRQARVLVVGDEASARRYLERLLCDEGFIVQAAGDGRGALEVATQDLPAVVVLDLEAVGRHELLRALRLREVDVPVLVVVAATDVTSAYEAIRDGATGYLTSPLDGVAVVLAVEQALETRALRREANALRAKHDELADEARRRLLARQALLSTVAHDVRAQLAAVTMVASSLTRGALPDEHRRKLALVPRAVKRLERLVDDLLDIDKLEAGRLPLDLSPARASSLLDDVAGLIQPVAAERGVLVTTSVISDFDVRCARDRIVQVLERLGSNAIRITPRSGVVRLRAEQRDGRGWFAVDDGRPCPSREDAELLVDPNEARAPGEAPSIDRTLAERIVDAHGGSLKFESHADGTTLQFDLPLEEASAAGGVTVAGKGASAASW